MLISEDPSYALLIVYSDGQLSLFNLPDFALLHSGNVVREAKGDNCEGIQCTGCYCI